MTDFVERRDLLDKAAHFTRCSAFSGFAVLLLLLFAACAQMPRADLKREALGPKMDLASLVPEEKITTPVRERVQDALLALDQGDLFTASAYVNQALKMDIRNSYLQFLNAYIYHHRVLTGDAESFSLAEQGYKLAIKFDPTNWLSYHYLGLFYLDQRNYRAALEAFANAVFFEPNRPDSLYQLAKASYYAGNPAVATAALERILELEEGRPSSPDVIQALVVTYAAANRPDLSKSFLEQLSQQTMDESLIQRLDTRADQWRSFHSVAVKSSTKRRQLAQTEAEMNALPGADDMNTLIEADSGDPLMQSLQEGGYQDPFAPQADDAFGQDFGAGGYDSFTENEMVVVDVVIIGTEEDITNSAGLNLLSGLQLQFGTPGIGGQAAFSVETEDTENNFTGDVNSRTITSAIGIPAISYSLNIANANRSENQILAKPTLVALADEFSQFFSGVAVNAAAVSGGAGDSIEVREEIGVKLEVTPEILPNDFVKLKVFAERTFLTQPSQSVVFEFRLDTTKTAVNATVAMKFGETLILSGLSERELENNRDGVPGLQDVPVMQYLFSRSQKRSFDKSILILLTPRRPEYTHRRYTAAEDAPNARETAETSEAINRLAERNGDWFRPEPNTVSVFRSMKTNVLYQEFRQGDYAVEEWQNQPENRERLKAAINWLYF